MEVDNDGDLVIRDACFKVGLVLVTIDKFTTQIINKSKESKLFPTTEITVSNKRYDDIKYDKQE